jgi:F420-dependent oxidoreductase-like protein
VTLDVAVMVEGQDGVDWPRWRDIAAATEDGGLYGLFRSDHFVAHRGTRPAALEMWVSQTWLASHTSRIRFGPLVAPLTLRHPVVTALTAAAIDDLSGGRFRLGLGAGWQEREHRAFGFELPPLKERFDRFAEGVAVVTALLRGDEPVTLPGRHFRLEDALLTPRPAHRTPITIGGRGPLRTLPLVAKHADEWNVTGVAVDGFAELGGKLDALLRQNGRDPAALRRTLMTTVVFGRDDAELRERLAGRAAAELIAQGRFVGTAAQIADQLRPWAEAGLDGVYLRWERLDDAAGIRRMGEALLPALTRR